jgi:hypothetical protein
MWIKRWTGRGRAEESQDRENKGVGKVEKVEASTGPGRMGSLDGFQTEGAGSMNCGVCLPIVHASGSARLDIMGAVAACPCPCRMPGECAQAAYDRGARGPGGHGPAAPCFPEAASPADASLSSRGEWHD